MTEDERNEAKTEAARQLRRTGFAAAIAVVATVRSGLVGRHLLSGVGPGGAAVLQPLLALLLSVAIIAGLRALDGPLNLGGKRRDAQATSSAASAVLLWLSCFGAIQAAILIVDVSARLSTDRPDCAPGVSERVSGVLVDDSFGTRRLFSFEGCRTHGTPATDAAGKGSNG